MATIECPVCYENYDIHNIKPKVLACGHSVCEVCSQHMLRNHPRDENREILRCPVCRRGVVVRRNYGYTGNYNLSIIVLLHEIEDVKSESFNCISCKESSSIYRSYICDTCTKTNWSYENELECWTRYAEIKNYQNFVNYFSNLKGICANCALHQHIRQNHVCKDFSQIFERFVSDETTIEVVQKKKSLFSRLFEFFKK